LAGKATNVAAIVENSGSKLAASNFQAGASISRIATNFGFGIDKIIKDFKDSLSNFKEGAGGGGGGSFAYGGFTGSAGGMVHPNEVVLPLSKPARAKEIFSQMPPGLKASLAAAGGGSGAVFAPTINVSGETLESMEAVAIRALQQAFRNARVASTRGGSNLSSGLSTIS